jgi:aminoglycoside/choline kinase family phosphotransferase
MKFNNLKKLRGDASSRVFFRNFRKKPTSILVYADKDKKSNLLIYDSINKIFLKNNILAPKLLSENYSKNYIEIEDFGNQTIFDLFQKKKVNKFIIFKKIIKLLNKIQLIHTKKIKGIRNFVYKVPKYNSKILYKETKIFVDWYIDQKLSKIRKKKFEKEFLKITKNLIKKINLKNDTFVHRDFHISNIMIFDKKIGVIDTQDALIGNKAYDLASLVDDVRFETSNIMKKKILNYYLKSQRNLNKDHFINDFEIISILRNFKIIGIFTRLALRDNKRKYLKLIPYAWKLIKLRSRKNNKFAKLNNLLETLKKK